MKSKKRDRTSRAFMQGFKSGLKGHEIETCPYQDGNLRGLWCGGWREGRGERISGNFSVPDHSSFTLHQGL